jgi:hypothetical protein
MVRTAAFDS